MSNVAGSVLAPGTTVAGYRIEALIGRGGMGAVYRAEEEGLGRKVALKVIAPELAQDERFRNRFLHESQIAASLDHPHVIPIYQAGEEDGLLFLAMRYVEGSDLAKVLAEAGALEPRRTVDILSQVAEALDAAHEKGLVHRDVKPSNILIAEAAGSEHCYLSDFGLTKRTGSLSGVSAPGDVVGTLEYVAPEQITGDPLDERADVYSLGCVLYECLTGQSPFPRATDVALLWAHVHEEPTPPSKAKPELPKELDTVLARALAKEPGRRYRSAGELLAATRSALRIGDPTVQPERGRSRRLVAGAAVIVLLAIATVAAFLFTRDSGGLSSAPNSVVALDPSGSISAVVPVGARPVAITSGAGALWVANLDDQSVTRVDVASRQAVRTIPIGDAPTALAATRTAVWVTHGARDLSKIDARYDHVTSTRSLAASGSFFGGTVRPTLAAFGSIWVVDPDGVVSRVNPDSARRQGSVGVGNAPSAIAAGAGSVWVTNSADGTVTRIDPATLVAATIPVGHGPAAVAVNAAGAWVANAGDNALVRIDTGTNAVAGTTPVGEGPAAVLATPTALWVANGRDGTVMRLDPRTGEVSKTIHVGGTPNALATAGGHVWVAIAPAPPHPAAAGGVARLTMEDDFASLDPALGSWLQYTTCAHLVTYPDKPAPEGSRIVPEVAEAVPDPTAGGTTYTFRIRRGFRFSPPSNEVVTAMTFKSTIERVSNPRLKSWLANQFSSIVGYRAYVTGKAREISGIVARGQTLTIRLSQPDGGFLAGLAGGSACAVPRDTPVVAGGINDIPSAGPYYIASYTPRQQLVLQRNPSYHGDRPHRLEQIVVAIGIDPARALEQVEAGEADYALGLPREAGPRLESAYGPGSEAAKAGYQQYFISEALGARYLHMNTSRRLFSDVRLRRAVNYAIDRRALAAQGRRAAETNPFNAGAPTDDYIPPSAAGAADFHLYPLTGPDLRRAKRIAGRVHATAIMYTPNLSPWREEAQIVRRDLKPLGIDVTVMEFPIGAFFTRIARRGEPFDLAVSGYSFSADPVQSLALTFDGSAIGSSNFSAFNDTAFNRKLHAVAKLSGAKRYRAANRLALELARDSAPAAAFATTASRDFFSARIGCQVYQPVWGMDLAALCLRE